VEASTANGEAEAAGLSYSSDEQPGITRRRAGHGLQLPNAEWCPIGTSPSLLGGVLETYAAGDLPPVSSRRLQGLDCWESGLMRFLRARS
jgi:hypothetical protein